MNTTLIQKAVHRAIQHGAKLAPSNPLVPEAYRIGLNSNLAIEPYVLEAYLAALRGDPLLARFDSSFATVPSGGSLHTTLEVVATRLLGAFCLWVYAYPAFLM
jgi:hypothetical protein